MGNADKVVHKVRYLVTGLPEDLAPASPHVQIFDNYIEETELRLRKERQPQTDQYRFFIDRIERLDLESHRFSRIELSKGEYDALSRLRGREIRKNRYQVILSDVGYAYDVYLGAQTGLCIATANTGSREEFATANPPPESVKEITSDAFFDGNNLVDMDIEGILAHLK